MREEGREKKRERTQQKCERNKEEKLRKYAIERKQCNAGGRRKREKTKRELRKKGSKHCTKPQR